MNCILCHLWTPRKCRNCKRAVCLSCDGQHRRLHTPPTGTREHSRQPSTIRRTINRRAEREMARRMEAL